MLVPMGQRLSLVAGFSQKNNIRYTCGMRSGKMRIQLLLTGEIQREFECLSHEMGLKPRELVRMAVVQLLHREEARKVKTEKAENV